MSLVEQFNAVINDYDKLCDLFEESQISERDELNSLFLKHFNCDIVAFYFIHTRCGIDLYYDFDHNIPLGSDPEDFDLYVPFGTYETASIMPLEQMIVDDVEDMCAQLEVQSVHEAPSQIQDHPTLSSVQYESQPSEVEIILSPVQHESYPNNAEIRVLVNQGLIVEDHIHNVMPQSPSSEKYREYVTSLHTEDGDMQNSNAIGTMLAEDPKCQNLENVGSSIAIAKSRRFSFSHGTTEKMPSVDERAVFHFEQLKWKRRKLDDVKFVDVTYCNTQVFITRSVMIALHLTREYAAFSCKLGDISFVCLCTDTIYARNLAMWLFSQVEQGRLRIDK